MSVLVQLPQWQLVIHFSSAARSVPCVLIRANSLVGLTQVSLKHWSDLLPGCTLTSARSGNYYCSSHFRHKHTVPPTLTHTHACGPTCARTHFLQKVYVLLCVREFTQHVIVHKEKSVKCKHMHTHWESKGRDSAWRVVVLPGCEGGVTVDVFSTLVCDVWPDLC